MAPTYWLADEKGRRHPRLRPLYFRLRALHGDREARAYCQAQAIPLEEMDEGEFRVWEARTIGRWQQQPVAEAAPPLSPNTPVPGSRALNQRTYLPYKDD